MKLFKKALAILLTALLAAMLMIPAAAFDWSHSEDEDYIEDEEGVYVVYPEKHPNIKVNMEEGAEFGFNYSYINDHNWINVNLVNKAKFPEANNGYLGNIGITLLLKGGDNSFEVRIVAEGTGWDNPYAAFSGKVDGCTSLGDENWHKVTISKASGKWSLTIGGVEVFADLTDEQSAVVDGLIGGGTSYISFGSDSGKGEYKIAVGAKTDALISESLAAVTTPEETTTVPETTEKPADTTKNDTDKPADTTTKDEADKPADTTAPAPVEEGNSSLWIYIVAGVVIVVAAVVIVVALKKKK